MNKKINISGIVASLLEDNIDTDQIIPTEYLKSIKKFGFGDYLFDGWRYLDEGNLNTPIKERRLNDEFILNQSPYDEATILLSGKNFGCGSSREHAVWALRDFGIQAVIAESFGDIFHNNCFKNGILPIALKRSEIEHIHNALPADPDLTIDLKKMCINLNATTVNFKIEKNLVERIISGKDDIDITLQYSDEIKSFEEQRLSKTPWLV